MSFPQGSFIQYTWDEISVDFHPSGTAKDGGHVQKLASNEGMASNTTTEVPTRSAKRQKTDKPTFSAIVEALLKKLQLEDKTTNMRIIVQKLEEIEYQLKIEPNEQRPYDRAFLVAAQDCGLHPLAGIE